MDEPRAVALDLARYPFSRYGSYFSFSMTEDDQAELGGGLYLHTHHGGSARLFRIDPARNGESVAYKINASTTELVLCADGGEIRIVIDCGGSVRVRGEGGMGLRLEMPPARWRFAYQLSPDAWGFNLPKSGVQLALDLIHGQLAMHAPWEKGEGFCYVTTKMIALLSPADDGKFEAAIDEFSTTWIPPERSPFDESSQEVRQSYREWVDALPQVHTSRDAVRERAAYVNWSAVVRPAGHLTRMTMLMSKMSMCNVYSWDHAFNAMAHWAHQPDLAWDQFMVFAEKTDQHGKMPDNMNDQNIMYTFAKPPIHGWALRWMWNERPSHFTRKRQAEAYAQLSRWTRWWTVHRTWEGDTLPHYIHGFDSGWDNSTIFDAGTPLVSPDLAAYLSVQQDVLGDLATALGRDEEAAEWKAHSNRTLAALIDELWDVDRFVGRLRPSGTTVRCESLINCMPVVLGSRLPQEVQTSLVSRIREHVTQWGLATEKPGSSQYTVRGYWRGPIWAPVTLLAVSGLAELGEDDLVETIAAGFTGMCERSGFAENFDALTGEGHFDPAYTWTSSVYLILASRYASRRRD